MNIIKIGAFEIDADGKLEVFWYRGRRLSLQTMEILSVSDSIQQELDQKKNTLTLTAVVNDVATCPKAWN